MKKEHLEIVDKMISQARRETRTYKPSPEALSMAEAVFRLLGSQAFLAQLLANDELGRSYFEKTLVEGKIDDRPKSQIVESVVLVVGYDTVNTSWFKLKGCMGLVHNFPGWKYGKKDSEDAVRRWAERAYGEFGTVEDIECIEGSDDWEMNIIRDFNSPKDLAQAHGLLMNKMIKELQNLSGFKTKK